MERAKDTDYTINYLSSVLENYIQRYPEDIRVSQMNEAQLCKAFKRYMVGTEAGVEHCFLSIDGDYIYMYDGKCFKAVDEVKIKYCIMEVLERLEVNDLYSNNSCKKIADVCMIKLRADEELQFEPNRRWAIFDNCVYDLMDFKVKEHSIEYHSDLRFNFNYKENAYSALWAEKLAETIPDESMRLSFQEFCGSLLDCRNYKIELACFMVGGSGQNGKTMIAMAIKGIFDSSVVSRHTFDLLFKSDRREYYIADADGKVLNFVDDLDYKDFSGGIFKSFVSNDEFSARSPYGRPIKTKKLPKLLCTVNDLPPTTDDSGGYERRILPILCPNYITEEMKDETLPEKLKAEEVKQAIFCWMLEGYKRVVANNGKVTVPNSAKEVREEYMAQSNSARRWISESGYIPVMPNSPNDIHWKSLEELMPTYREFCMKMNDQARTANSVGKVLARMGFRKSRRNGRSFYCIGVKGVDKGVKMSEYDKKMNEYKSVDEEVVVDNDDLPF